MIDLNPCIAQLEVGAVRIQALVAGVGDAQARWKPALESWSVLEVVNHLCDEEREDFRARLKHILDRLEGLPPPIDPTGWVTARAYNERDLAESLAKFVTERAQSAAWLRQLVAPDWDSAVEGPFGRLRAGDLLLAWLAHDLLHQRQLVELHYAYLRHAATPFDIGYAGEW